MSYSNKYTHPCWKCLNFVHVFLDTKGPLLCSVHLFNNLGEVRNAEVQNTRNLRTLCKTKKKETNGRPGKHNKGPKLDTSNFFGTMRLFSKYFLSPKGPLQFFLKFCSKLKFQKAQRVSIFTILKTLRFLSLRYGADF